MKARRGLSARFARLVGAAAATAIVATTWLTVGAAAASTSPAPDVTQTFNYLGVVQDAVVPAGANYVGVRVLGGKGGRQVTPENADNPYVTGGDGAEVTGGIAVTPGQVLSLFVAGAGGNSANGFAGGGGGWGSPGSGGSGGTGYSAGGGIYVGSAPGGGGASSIQRGGQTLVVAGGGGGGGSQGYGIHGTLLGGPGGSSGTTVDPGHKGNGFNGGKGGGGGTNGTSGGGAGSTGIYKGGSGGGGGAGYRGGGGGSGGGGFFGNGGGGGGGAGSSYFGPQLQHPSAVRGTSSDGNGVIVLTWQESDAPVCPAQTVQVPATSPGVPFALQCSDYSQPTRFQVVTVPRYGSLDDRNLTAGTFTYVPLPGFIGKDSMVFEAWHGDYVSAPATVTFDVEWHPPSPTLSASASQVTQGQSPVFTVTLPRDATGVVGFYDDDLPGRDKGIGTVPLVGGVATLTAPTRDLVLGRNVIYASYSGDARYSPVNSPSIVITVTPPPSITLSTSATEVTQGQSPVFTVTLPEDATGVVGFYDESLPGSDKGIGTAPVVDGVATLTAPTQQLVLGRNLIHASYSGDTRHSPENSPTIVITVAPPPMTLSASATEVTQGQSPVFTVTLPEDATGVVGFYDESLPGSDKGIGTAPVVGGVATLTAPTQELVLGRNLIHASYSGDARYSPEDSPTIVITVAPPPMTLIASATEVTQGQSPVFTVTLPEDATGVVGFYDESLPGSDKGIGTAPVVGGVATLTVPTQELVLGRNLIHASYSGDASHSPEDSPTIVITVTPR